MATRNDPLEYQTHHPLPATSNDARESLIYLISYFPRPIEIEDISPTCFQSAETKPTVDWRITAKMMVIERVKTQGLKGT